MRCFLSILLLVATCQLSAQTPITRAEYQSAVDFQWENYNNKRVFNLTIQPHWFPDSSGLWFVDHAPDGKSFRKIEFADPTEIKPLFNEEKLPFNDPVDRVEYRGATELIVYVGDTSYQLNPITNELAAVEDEGNSDKKGSWTAYAENYNLHLRNERTGDTRPLSTTGKKGYEYGSYYGWGDLIEGEGGTRPEQFWASWSPDSLWLQTDIVDFRSANKMYLLDHSVDTLYRPRLYAYYRGSPGDTGMVYQHPVFFNIRTGEEIRPPLPRATHINTIDATWSESEPGVVYLKKQSRGYQDLSIYRFDLNSKVLTRIYHEESKTNIDNFGYEFCEDAGAMFFLSEKAGWRQLYRLDLDSGNEQRLTEGEYVINDVNRIDAAKRVIYFTASGREPGRNPYHRHLYRINFDGTDLRLLTSEDLNHAVSLSPDGRYFVDNASTVTTPTRTLLRSTETGKTLTELGRADVSRLAGWSPPEVFTATARDGKTIIYGALWKPTNFDPAGSYPVIECSYTGPHTQLFPREFSRALYLQTYAELGFIAVVVDGLGSAGRSKAFHDYSYKNLGGNLEDHVGALRQLGERYSWVDTSRIGIFGHSAGGYDAGHAVLAYPDFYKVAVASSADHDHRMEKAWWPEMYMGWPVDSAYHLQSNVTMAGNLKGKLLLVHGGVDENVNPSATFKLAEALINADKPFDLMILPSQHHGYRGKAQRYFTKLRWNYFVEHLRGVEPIWDIDMEAR